MLMTLFALIAESGDNPGEFRTDVGKALCDLADTYKLPGVAPEIAKEARDFANTWSSLVSFKI
jgi:hypothetical protein